MKHNTQRFLDALEHALHDEKMQYSEDDFYKKDPFVNGYVRGLSLAIKIISDIGNS